MIAISKSLYSASPVNISATVVSSIIVKSSRFNSLNLVSYNSLVGIVVVVFKYCEVCLISFTSSEVKGLSFNTCRTLAIVSLLDKRDSKLSLVLAGKNLATKDIYVAGSNFLILSILCKTEASAVPIRYGTF